MEVAPDSSHSALLKECSEQKQSGMITKYHSKSPFTFVMFFEVTEATVALKVAQCDDAHTTIPMQR